KRLVTAGFVHALEVGTGEALDGIQVGHGLLLVGFDRIVPSFLRRVPRRTPAGSRMDRSLAIPECPTAYPPDPGARNDTPHPTAGDGNPPVCPSGSAAPRQGSSSHDARSGGPRSRRARSAYRA